MQQPRPTIKTKDGEFLEVIEYIGFGAYGFVLKVKNRNDAVSALKLVPVWHAKDALDSDTKLEREMLFHTFLKSAPESPKLAQAESWWIESKGKNDYLRETKTLRQAFNIKQVDHPSYRIKFESPENSLVDVYYFQMKFYNKGNLGKWLRENSHILSDTYHSRLCLLTDVLDGLQFLHDRDLMHRDLSASNIFLCDDAHRITAVIGDFNTIISYASGAKWLLTKTHQYFTNHVGTDQYSAPEIATEVYDKSCDMYSVGVIMLNVFWNLLDAKEIAGAIYNLNINGKPLPINNVLPHSEILHETARNLLSTKPEQRYGAKVLCEKIRHVLDIHNNFALTSSMSSMYIAETGSAVTEQKQQPGYCPSFSVPPDYTIVDRAVFSDNEVEALSKIFNENFTEDYQVWAVRIVDQCRKLYPTMNCRCSVRDIACENSATVWKGVKQPAVLILIYKSKHRICVVCSTSDFPEDIWPKPEVIKSHFEKISKKFSEIQAPFQQIAEIALDELQDICSSVRGTLFCGKIGKLEVAGTSPYIFRMKYEKKQREFILVIEEASKKHLVYIVTGNTLPWTRTEWYYVLVDLNKLEEFKFNTSKTFKGIVDLNNYGKIVFRLGRRS